MTSDVIAVRAPARSVSLRAERIVPVLVVVVVLVAVVYSITPWPVGVFTDDAIYTILGKALASGDGYRMINLPGAPHATHYPPGYPFVLSLLWRIWPAFPDNVVLFKFANAVFLAAGAGGVYWFARGRLAMGVGGAAATALVGTASVLMLHLSGMVLSEPLFIALLLPSLVVVERAAEDGKLGDAVLAGLLLGLLAMIRTIGAVAVGAAVLVLLVRRRPKPAVLLAATSALFIAPWQWWVSAYQSELPASLAGKYGPYGPWLTEAYRAGGIDYALDVVIKNVTSLGSALGYYLMPVSSVAPRAIALAVGLSLVVTGAVVLIRRAPVLVVSCGLYIAVVLAWPFAPHRFIIAIWPVLVVITAAGIRAVWTWAPNHTMQRRLRVAALVATAYMLAGHATYNARGYWGRGWEPLQRVAGEPAKALVAWVSQATGPGDVVAADQDPLLYLYTGRLAVPSYTFLAREYIQPLPQDEVIGWVESILETYRPRYYVTGWPPLVEAADSLATRNPPELRLLGTVPKNAIYERLAP